MKTVLKKIIPFTLGQKLRGLWQKTQTVYYRGNNYTCPFCGNSFRKMLPGGFDLPVIREKQIIGAGRRENDVCPRCYSIDRDRLIYLYLTNKTDSLRKPIKLLHIAPGGALRAFLSSRANIEYHMGTKHHEGFYYTKDISIIDITEINYPDNTFDVILCNHVLEHISDDLKAMRELYRVLKGGGWAILQVPISKSLKQTFEDVSVKSAKEREKVFGQFDHVRIYGQDYPHRLAKAGFDVHIHNPVKERWNINNINRFAINKEENLFVAHKPKK